MCCVDLKLEFVAVNIHQNTLTSIITQHSLKQSEHFVLAIDQKLQN